MTYDELYKIAKPHICEGEKLPSDSLILLTQLHIPYKLTEQCNGCHAGDTDMLNSTHAFLSIDSNRNRTVYFNSNTCYWNFYIFHEIAHFLLNSEDDCEENETDADMLACILAAPIENLPSGIKTANELSSVCKIPLDKAEAYWQEIKPGKQRPWVIAAAALIAILGLFVCRFIYTGGNIAIPNENYKADIKGTTAAIFTIQSDR